MKQLQQSVNNGALSIVNIPTPLVQPAEVLIANVASLVSAGTEKMTRELARKSLLGKARARPDQFRQVMQKIRTEGVRQTYQRVKARLDVPMTMGYSSAGVVLACGRDVQEFKPGDRVASNGPHAEVVAVPRNLCARVPDNVPFEQAAFAVMGAISLQGVRLTKTHLGETVLVIGLGLVGQFAVAILRAAGCRVLAADPDKSRCSLARTMGAEVAETHLSAADVESLTGGIGADAVIIAASTESNQPITFAAEAVRRKGRIVLVGVVGLELDRRPFYFKEAEFVVSCSYGPGRYQADYEQLGRDYPPAYVRWTEQRNMAAVLELIASGKIDVSPLISHRYDIDDAERAYDLIDKKTEPFIGIIFDYPGWTTAGADPRIEFADIPARSGPIGVGVLGTGAFATSVMLPKIQREPSLRPVIVCSASGASATRVGRQSAFLTATSAEDEVFEHSDVDVVFSITPHNEHARHVIKAIRAGKSIFIEKPLCLTIEELAEIERALHGAGDKRQLVMVGFNRRFSPAAIRVRDAFAGVIAPKTVSIRFNAGQIPADHWTQIDEVGGGRIIGEACHAIDLATFLTGSPPVRVFAESIGGKERPAISDDQSFITLRHANGSVSSIAYLAGGDGSMAKERVEVIGGGQAAVIDDFRNVTIFAHGRAKKEKFRSQDKGHAAEIIAFVQALRDGGAAPISWADIRAVSLASILAVQSIREGVPLELA